MGDIDSGYTATGREGKYLDANGKGYVGWGKEDAMAELVRRTSASNDSLAKAILAGNDYAFAELEQKYKIAQMGESGANKRAGISAAASRYAADKSAGASKYSADRSLEGTKYSTDAQERLGQGRLGLDYLTAASQMRGADNYLQQSDFLRGASARQDVPLFMQNLARGVSGTAFQAPGGSPQGYNMQGLLGKITGGQTGMSGQDQSFLQAVRNAASKGLHTLAPGTLESLSPAELGAFKSAVEYSGDGGTAWDFNELLNQYQKAQVGQGSAAAA